MKNILDEYKRYVQKRLEPISEILVNIAAGDFSKHLELPEKEDEFTELYVGVEFMLEDLIEHKRKRDLAEESLLKHQADLEKQVMERTKELKEINEQLKIEIKEHEADKKELLEIEKRFRIIYDTMSDVIFILNADMNISYITPSVENLSGYKPEELIGRSMDDLDFLSSESLALAFVNFERLFNGEEVGFQIYEFVSKNGKKIFTEVNNTPIFKDGELHEIICVARDITERIKTEDALRNSEEWHKSLVKTSPDGITATDLEGKIIFASTQTAKLHGFNDPKELINKNALDLIARSDQKRALKNMKKTFNEGTIRNIEYKLMKKDGSTFVGELNAAVVKDTQGKPMYFIATTRDITQRKLFEAKIKNALDEKDVLLREIHHRVKNNIQVISSMLNLHTKYIKDDYYSVLIKEIQDRIRSMALIHEKLYKSKDISMVNFDDYIKELVNELFRSYGTNTKRIQPVINVIDVSLDIDTSIPCGLIINELVSNSLKHAFPDGGTGSILIDLRLENGNIILKTKDTGIGISEQIDLKNPKTFGLQLVVTLVEQLHGQIAFNIKEGTEVVICFKK